MGIMKLYIYIYRYPQSDGQSQSVGWSSSLEIQRVAREWPEWVEDKWPHGGLQSRTSCQGSKDIRL